MFNKILGAILLLASAGAIFFSAMSEGGYVSKEFVDAFVTVATPVILFGSPVAGFRLFRSK